MSVRESRYRPAPAWYGDFDDPQSYMAAAERENGEDQRHGLRFIQNREGGYSSGVAHDTWRRIYHA